MECHRAIIQSRIGEREVTFMTNYNQLVTGLKSVKARQLQEQYSKDFFIAECCYSYFFTLGGTRDGGKVSDYE